MNWLKWLRNVATRVVLPAVTAVQRVAQQREAASKQKPEPKAVSAADGVSKPKPAAVPSPLPPQIPQRRTAAPDRTIGPRIDPTPAPVITPGEQRSLQDLLDKPRNRGLHLLVERDAEIVLKIAHRIPGILETAIQNCRSFKGAFDYLLADGVSLAEEEIAALLEQSDLYNASPCPQRTARQLVTNGLPWDTEGEETYRCFDIIGPHPISRGAMPVDSIQEQIEDCSPHPNADGQKYVDAAEAAGIDPVLLGMIARNEWQNRQWTRVFPFVVTQLKPDYSYGFAQVQRGLAVDIVSKHPELFTEYPQLYIEGQLDEGRVSWESFVNVDFNLRLAALRIRDLETMITRDVVALGFEITDSYCGENTLSSEDISKLVAVAYNQPWNVGDSNDLYSRIRSWETMEERRAAVLRTMDIDHVQNVWGNKSIIESEIGVPLGCR
ncbi:MAG: hypothetical protein IT323_00345 [Anaerolineae bacterium]|nr:hypothetical protein [Anaerolineae bacterium]